MRTDLTGKVAIVTGGGSGIGKATALLFADRGAKVVVATSREASATPVVEMIWGKGGKAAAAWGDIADETTAQQAIAAALDAFGRIDILVNNAALTDVAALAKDGLVLEADPAVWQRTLAVNLVGPVLMCKHAIPEMIRTGGGSIVMVSSGRGTQGDLGFTAYGASKAGLINLSQNVAAQYGKRGIRCNVAVVGMVMTPAIEKSTPPNVVDLLREHHLTPEIGMPDDIAEAIAFLASDAAAFVTGATLAVDGGVTSHTAPFADYVRMAAEGQVYGT